MRMLVKPKRRGGLYINDILLSQHSHHTQIENRHIDTDINFGDDHPTHYRSVCARRPSFIKYLPYLTHLIVFTHCLSQCRHIETTSCQHTAITPELFCSICYYTKLRLEEAVVQGPSRGLLHGVCVIYVQVNFPTWFQS